MENSEYRDTLNFLVGLAVGALIGSGAALLLAPQSGSRTRKRIAHRAGELTDAATDRLEDARGDARRLATRARKRADDTGERLSDAVERGRDRLRR